MLDVSSDVVEAVIHRPIEGSGHDRLMVRCFSCPKIAVYPSWPSIPIRVSWCATSSPGEKWREDSSE
jgi:hypothetical protein